MRQAIYAGFESLFRRPGGSNDDWSS